MHRTIEITVPSSEREALVRDLERLEDVIGLAVHPGAARKPKGDLIIVQALNQGADDVLRCVSKGQGRTRAFLVVTGEAASFSDPERQQQIDSDSDEAIWEEIQTSLRNRGQLTTNFVLLMGLGGAIAATGLAVEPVPQVTAFIAAAIIAPAFEPLAKLPLALVLHNSRLLKDAILSAFAGYMALFLAAAGTILLLRGLGVITLEKIIGNPEVQRIMHVPLDSIFVSACAALAGVLVETAYRESLLAGPVIGLLLLPAAALLGAGTALLSTELIRAGAIRLGVDAILIVSLGVIAFWLKQRALHQRKPIS